MLKLFIRYIAIIFCTDYTYQKLLNQKSKSFIKYLLFIVVALSTSILFFYAQPKYRFLVILLHIIFFTLHYCFISHENKKTIFSIVVLSYGISYICFFLAQMSIIIPLSAIYTFVVNISIPTEVLQFLIACLQCILCRAIFRSKRLRNGMPFLRNPFFAHLGFLLGILIAGCAMFLFTIDSTTNDSANFLYIFFIISFFILSILIFSWWRNQAYQTYLLQAKEKECSQLEEQLAYYQDKLKTLEEENSRLSKVIHRDNKLIPSLQLAVHNFLSQMSNENSTTLTVEAEKLLAQLEKEMKERSSTVNTLSNHVKKLPTTGVSSLDQLLAYMQQRCHTQEISFDCSVSKDIASILETEESISEKELSTLLADLLENALIATKHHQGKHIFIYMGITDGIFSLEVWDSGDKFPKEVLYHFGRKRYTTHKNEGGSGIGLMVTYELLKKYQASFLIDETHCSDSFFTKKVIVCFDGKGTYTLHSQRSKEELAYLSRCQNLKLN